VNRLVPEILWLFGTVRLHHWWHIRVRVPYVVHRRDTGTWDRCMILGGAAGWAGWALNDWEVRSALLPKSSGVSERSGRKSDDKKNTRGKERFGVYTCVRRQICKYCKQYIWIDKGIVSEVYTASKSMYIQYRLELPHDGFGYSATEIAVRHLHLLQRSAHTISPLLQCWSFWAWLRLSP